jgi:hypothetical protein
MATEITPWRNTMSPAEFDDAVDAAKAKAKTFVDIVEQQELFTMIGPSKHLNHEAWETIAAGYGLTAAVDKTTYHWKKDSEEDNGDELFMVEAHAVVLDREGTIRGGAVASCGRDEPNWATKPVHQVASMAGTRASAKALRLMLSWVVEIAGYEPTPSEEIVDKKPRAERGTTAATPRNTSNRAESPNKGSSRRQAAPTSGEHGTCPIHNVPWRQNTNDRGTWLSHKDGEGWCNESSVRRQMEERSDLPEEPPVDDQDEGLPEFTTAVIDVNGEVVPDDEPIDLPGVLSFLGISREELEKDVLSMPWDEFLRLAGDRAPEVAIERYRKIQEEGDGSV